jgi:hypothetical protein
VTVMALSQAVTFQATVFGQRYSVLGVSEEQLLEHHSFCEIP